MSSYYQYYNRKFETSKCKVIKNVKSKQNNVLRLFAMGYPLFAQELNKAEKQDPFNLNPTKKTYLGNVEQNYF